MKAKIDVVKTAQKEEMPLQHFDEIQPQELCGNVFDKIGRGWMLITSGDQRGFNTMTASWGGLGVLWNKNVAFAFIRPQRHTFGFTEKNELLTLSFFSEEYRAALNLCGTKSGRDTDKAKESGLTPLFLDGTTSFAQASEILVCKKLYADTLKPGAILQPEVFSFYSQSDYHQLYICEILRVYAKA